MPPHKNPCPGRHEIYNFGILFLGHHNYTLSWSDLCLGGKKKFFKKNNVCSLSDLYALAQEPLGVMKFTILVNLFLVTVTIPLICLVYAWE